ncbi:MAG: Rieske 2Fe-2S domain-containing protein [Sphingomonadaceae bacterium]|nr:Rieske 2Fe-2S domain-containing protein [Sphingomonadaceae bacterium]
MTGTRTALERGYSDLPVPFGWFAVALAKDVANGEVVTMNYFGTEFVVWRGGDGEVRAVDPFCPHLGAHLGVNSDVVGNDLRCPYHHWSFNGDGGVTRIPYTEVIAPSMKQSCLPTWPIEEVDGVVWVWYHPNKAAPKWEVARIPDCPDGDWVLAMTRDWIVNIHCREIPENGQDYAHFGAVHGVPFAPKGEMKVEGWTRSNKVVAEMKTPKGLMTGKIETIATGPGQSIIEYIDVTHVVQAQQVTPIDSSTTHIRWQMYHIPGLTEGRLRVTQARMRDLEKQITQDIPIWNNKKLEARPLLVKGDGPILAYRENYQKFFDFEEGPEPKAGVA